MSIESIVIIGTGNVATHLGKAFVKAGVTINAIVARKMSAATELAEKLGNVPTFILGTELPEADAYFIAVKDDAISEVALAIATKNRLLIHCSGATESDILNISGNPYGVVWPMQTLTKNNDVSLDQTLIAVNGSDAQVEQDIADLMGKITNRVVRVTETQRATLHMCAVWINNYTNHMFVITEQIMKDNDLDFTLLFPLINEHIEKLKSMPAHQLQTGPAQRGDMATLDKHLNLLNKYPEWKHLYDNLAQSIIKQALKEK